MDPSKELLQLYRKYGFKQYKMSKFEEYDLYAENKDFLQSNRIITFTDTNGKLMALKPDVTLSIIKNTKDLKDFTQKVFYDENVYRVSKGTDAFKEIRQVGLECIGDLDTFNILEVLTLAAESLKLISEDYMIDISSLSVLTGALRRIHVSGETEEQILKFIGEKNRHELVRTLRENAVAEDAVQAFSRLASLYGPVDRVIEELKEMQESVIFRGDVEDLEALLALLSPEIRSHISIDFSVEINTAYYNDIVFKGFVPDVPSEVLSGGQYGELLKRMGRKARAIGFAVYLDLLERVNLVPRRFDYDIVLLYNKEENPAEVLKALRALSENASVVAERTMPEGIRCRKLVKLENGEVITLEEYA